MAVDRHHPSAGGTTSCPPPGRLEPVRCRALNPPRPGRRETSRGAPRATIRCGSSRRSRRRPLAWPWVTVDDADRSPARRCAAVILAAATVAVAAAHQRRRRPWLELAGRSRGTRPRASDHVDLAAERPAQRPPAGGRLGARCARPGAPPRGDRRDAAAVATGAGSRAARRPRPRRGDRLPPTTTGGADDISARLVATARAAAPHARQPARLGAQAAGPRAAGRRGPRSWSWCRRDADCYVAAVGGVASRVQHRTRSGGVASPS